jgi:hypothetical protein
LDGVRYPPGAACLWHWTPAAEDAAVRAIVAVYADLSHEGRDAFRSALTAEDLHTVVAYAGRMALWARRTGLQEAVAAGLRSLALIDPDRVDWQDISIACAQLCYVGERIGMSLAEVVVVAADAAALAARGVGELLVEGAEERVDLGEAVGDWEVQTPDGPVFVHDFGESYDPEADLIAAALALAELIDAGPYWVRGIYAGSNPKAWVGADRSAAVAAACERITGCVSIHASLREPTPARLGLLTFFAEAASLDDADLLARARPARTHAVTVACGLSVGRVVGLVIASSGSSHSPPPEDVSSLQRFVEAARTVLSVKSD